MSFFRPRKPAISGARMTVWEYLFNGKFPFVDTPTVKWDRKTTGYAANVIPGLQPPSPPRAPFEIYFVKEDPTTHARTFRVNRGLWFSGTGIVYFSGLSPDWDMAGATTLGPSNPTDIILPSDTNLYYVWLTLCSGVGDHGNPLLNGQFELAYGFDIGANDDDDVIANGFVVSNGNSAFTDKWPTAPRNDPYHFLIGTINNSFNGTGRFKITQYLRSDLWNTAFRGCDSNLFYPSDHGGPVYPTVFCGDYDSGQWYWAGDTVRFVPESSLFVYEFTLGVQTAGSGNHGDVSGGPVRGVSPDPTLAYPAATPWILRSKSLKPEAVYGGGGDKLAESA